MDQTLKNRYWVLRHGRSIPNELGIIVAHKDNGILPEYGLAKEGFVQAKAAGKLFLKEFKELRKISIYSSPFSRTMETAKCVVEVLTSDYGSLEVNVLDELRERYFGPALELQSHDLHYKKIWDDDEADPLIGPEGGESVYDVASRVATVIPYIESKHEGHEVLLVSHNDTLTILNSVTKNLNLSQHRQFSLSNAELRRLT